MSVKIGSIIDGRQTYVGGSPRSGQGIGQVILFELSSMKPWTLVPKIKLNGPRDQIGTGFGYDLAVGDFNGDGSLFLVSLIRCQ